MFETVTGEYWCYAEPKLYEFKHFIFTPTTGLHDICSAEVFAHFKTSDAPSLLNAILEAKEECPYRSCSIRRSKEGALQIRISSYTLYDYDLFFAKKIDAYLDQSYQNGTTSDVKEKQSWGDWEYYRPEKRSEVIAIRGKGYSQVSSSPDPITGLEKARVRVDMHHPSTPNDFLFFEEFSTLLKECKIQHLEYKKYRGNYMVFLGNGRQGTDGAGVVCSDLEKLEVEMLRLIKASGYKMGFSDDFIDLRSIQGREEYSKLIESEIHIVLDERNPRPTKA